MKLVRRISLFIICSGLFAAGCILGFRWHAFFYPGTDATESAGREKTSVLAKKAAAALQEENVITADTSFIVIEVNVADQSEHAEEIPVPSYYMGMDREAFEKQIRGQNDSPPLTELQKGFQGSEIRSFSAQKVELCKFYKTQDEEPDTYFYLVIQKNKVVVLKADGITVYMETDIDADDLPADILQELLQRRIVNTQEDLYDFLESYSS